MNHLNEDKLIQYTFDLLESSEKQTVQQHLDTCAECQTALKQLQAKFAAMDAITDEISPSEELIQKTLRVKSKPIPLYRRRPVVWSAAAAAVVLVGFILFHNLSDVQFKEHIPIRPKRPVSKSTGSPLAKKDFDAPKTSVTAFPDDRMAALSGTDSAGTALTPPPGLRIVSADEIPDKPPFAPASAIELVVLPKPDKTQVTIYNSADLTLVRDTRKLTLKPGWNWLQFMWDGTLIDPTSLSLTPLEYADKIDIQQLVYPARLKDIGRWLIRSEVEGAVPFEITYFASGLSWRAFYMGTMNEDETTMDLKGYVNVSNNSGQDFINTQTRLIVGETRLKEDIAFLAQRRYPYGPDFPDFIDDREGVDLDYHGFLKGVERLPILGDMPTIGGAFYGLDGNADLAGGTSLKYDIKQIEKTGLSEYFLYTIEGTENLPNTWSKRLPSFDIKDIPVKSLYKYDENRYGKLAVRFLSFANDAEHELGETPIPEGIVKIYRNVNEQHNLSYIAQRDIKYIPVNEDVELNLGPARLVKIEPMLMEQKTENYTFDDKGNIDGWDDIEMYKVTITNTRNIPVDIEITWNMGTDAWELYLHDDEENSKSETRNPKQYQNSNDLNSKTTVEYKKHDKNRGRFTLTVPAKTEKTFGHTIRKYRQKRIETYVQKQKEQEQ